MDIEKARVALRVAREDLSLAVDYPDSSIYKERCKQTIRLITEVLGDSDEYKKLREKWDKELPGGEYVYSPPDWPI